MSWDEISADAISRYLRLSRCMVSSPTCALQAEATNSPSGSAATQYRSLPCPYSLMTSGHRVFWARCSSKGGPAKDLGFRVWGFGPDIRVEPGVLL